MRKLSCILTCSCILALSGCAKEEQILTCTLQSDAMAEFTEESTYEMKARGDEAFSQSSKSVMSFKDQETYALFVSDMPDDFEEDGYSMNITKDDEALSITLSIFMDMDVLSKERYKEISEDNTDFDFISLDKTRDNLKADGYTCSE